MCGGSPSERETETDNGRMEKLGAGADGRGRITEGQFIHSNELTLSFF